MVQVVNTEKFQVSTTQIIGDVIVTDVCMTEDIKVWHIPPNIEMSVIF